MTDRACTSGLELRQLAAWLPAMLRASLSCPDFAQSVERSNPAWKHSSDPRGLAQSNSVRERHVVDPEFVIRGRRKELNLLDVRWV